MRPKPRQASCDERPPVREQKSSRRPRPLNRVILCRITCGFHRGGDKAVIYAR